MTADIDTLGSVLNTDMTSSAKLVYIALVYHANKNTLVAWPSRELLAKETSLGQRTITRATNELVQAGFLTKKTGQTVARYTIPQCHNGRSKCHNGRSTVPQWQCPQCQIAPRT